MSATIREHVPGNRLPQPRCRKSDMLLVASLSNSNTAYPKRQCRVAFLLRRVSDTTNLII